jgi:hypothetical protein
MPLDNSAGPAVGRVAHDLNEDLTEGWDFYPFK